MFLDTAIAKLAEITVPNISANSSEEDREEHRSKLTATVMATSISGWASRFNEKERGNYYTFILRGVPDKFLKEVFQIRAASEMLTVNVETIRRKIRDKKIPVLNEGKVNTGVGYEITGDTVISLAKKNYQKENILAYCIEKYSREMVISLIQLLINEGMGFKDLTPAMIKSLANLAYVAEWKLKDIPKGKISSTDEEFYEVYTSYLEKIEAALEQKNNGADDNEEVDFIQKEAEYKAKIESLENENFDLWEENLKYRIKINELLLELCRDDLEKLGDDYKNVEHRKLVHYMGTLRRRIEYLECYLENGEEPNQQGRMGWPRGMY